MVSLDIYNGDHKDRLVAGAPSVPTCSSMSNPLNTILLPTSALAAALIRHSRSVTSAGNRSIFAP